MWLLLAALASLAAPTLLAATNPPGPERVLIVYNANWTGDEDGDGVQDSLEVANYYAQKRGVPASNLLGLPCAGYTSWAYGYMQGQYSNFVNEVLLPIRVKLAALGTTNIDIILLSYRLPYTVANSGNTTVSLDNALMAPGYWNTNSDNIAWLTNPYLEPTPTFGTDHGHFSHDLYKLNGNDIYLVSRLDGPTRVWGVMNLVDAARYGDRYVSVLDGYYHGNAYVDSENRKGVATDANLSADTDVQTGNFGNYASTDVNVAYGEHYVVASGMPLKWHRDSSINGTPGTFFQDGSSATNAPQALLYGGWYAANNYLPGVWDWLPGSVASDLDSDSLGYDIRSPFTLAWATQALLNGASCVCGVVGEPYTTGIPRPNVLLWGLLQGYNFAEASSLANPAIGWMPVAIGDPLYAPFAPKTPVLDTHTPGFSAGYPRVLQSTLNGNVVEVLVDDTPEPEVVRVRVDYGTNSSYGSVVSSLGYGRHHRLELLPLPGGTFIHYRVRATDPAGAVADSGDLTFTTPVQRPWQGVAATIPGTVQCAYFDEGGEGVAYHDREPENFASWQFRADTGVEIAGPPYCLFYYCYGGEWLNYTVDVAQTGVYQAAIYTESGGPGTFHLECDGGRKTGPLAPATNTTWTAVAATGIALPAGRHILRLVMDGDNQTHIGSFYYMQFSSMPPPQLSVNLTNANTALCVSWPADYLGWALQAQTNSLSGGLGWFALPGSASTNQVFLPLDLGAGSVFYRLVSGP